MIQNHLAEKLNAEQEEAPDRRDRQGKAQPMIGFNIRGRQRGFSYSHLYDYDFDGSSTLILHFTEHTITIEGSNLAKLVDSIHRHVETLVYQRDAFHAEAKEDDYLVTRIFIDKLDPEAAAPQ